MNPTEQTRRYLEARQFIEEIASSHGWIPPEELEGVSDKVLRSIGTLREKLGSSIRELATNLYQSQARFVFELIQNAEDNQYTKAAARGFEPYIQFDIHPDRVIVECNEDGFTPENVTAICGIGQSSKTRTDGQYYIGEKGIGFKSVFMVSKKVHIESGPYSFSFEHEEGESGMGLITPVYEPPRNNVQSPNGPLTFMTLTLQDDLDHAELIDKFHALPDTFLLFLTKLKRIVIRIHGAGERLQSSTTYSSQTNTKARCVTLTKTHELPNQAPETEEKTYHVTRKTLHNLPRDKRRDYNTAEVVLAFPLDSNSVPLVERQQVYAYLPLRDFGFPFLIQSDFITEASRQDVMECPRNLKILEGVSTTFLDAVLQLCDHPTLQYQWMRYLPESVPGSFWQLLLSGIQLRLSDARVLRPAAQGALKRISALRIVTSDFQDSEGNPLVADLAEKPKYIAPGYDQQGLVILARLGLKNLSWLEGYFRIKQDLKLGSSKAKFFASSAMLDDWHTRYANFLLKPFTNHDSSEQQERVKSLRIIPLRDGGWIKPLNETIYFQTRNNIKIPSDLGLKIVDPQATTLEARKTLYAKLGVSSAPVKTVRDLIVEKYSTSYFKTDNGDTDSINLCSSIDHLRYLYLTDCKSPIAKAAENLKNSESVWGSPFSQPTYATESLPKNSAYRYFGVFNHDEVWVEIDDSDVYLELDDQYGIKQFLKMNDETLSAELNFLHPKYMENPPVPPRNTSGPSWESWICDKLSILRRPRLVDRDNKDEISMTFVHIRDFSTSSFINTLKAHWDFYKTLMTKKLEVNISSLEVDTDAGRRRLDTTYIETDLLHERSAEFLPPKHFPFLPTYKDRDEDWTFLCRNFDVGMTDNIEFFLKVLRQMKAANLDSFSYQIYEIIQQRVWSSKNPKTEQEYLREYFENNELIGIPFGGFGGTIVRWKRLSDCLWDAPSYVSKFISLKTCLQDQATNATTCAFFKETLQVPDVSAINLMDELKIMPHGIFGPAPDTAILGDIYIRLQRFGERKSFIDFESAAVRLQIRDVFTKKKLIYVPPQRSWYAPNECVWSKRSPLPQQVAISEQYKDLKVFFCQHLQVQVPDLKMLVEGLKVLDKARNPRAEIKDLIWQINALEPDEESLKMIDDAKVLPVISSTGKLTLFSRTRTFAIVDRKPLADAFAGRIAVLDFSLDEVRRLQPFLSSMKIESRYLSKLVEEKSSVEEISSHPDTDLTRDLRRRAYALTRCAFHSNSLRTQSNPRNLYERLRKLEVTKTNGISSELCYKSGQGKITVEIARSKLHIHESDDKLRIFVPADPKDRELCYLRLLPQRLFNVLMKKGISAEAASVTESRIVNVIAALLKSSDFIIDELLEDAGIVQLPFQDEVIDDSQEQNQEIRSEISPIRSSSSKSGVRETDGRQTTPTGSHSRNVDDRSRSQTANSSNANKRDSFTSFFPSKSLIQFGLSLQDSQQPPPVFKFPSPPPSRDATPPRAEKTRHSSEYQRLLETVVQAARRKRGSFPSKGAFDLNNILNALPTDPYEEDISFDTPFGVRSENQLAHDMRIGAAGELYAFEILSNLKPTLPGFSRDNWKSTIRKLVTVHEDYSDMQPWQGAETADIIYNDMSGDFTKLLIENGYLDRKTWIDTRPKYYLEVKTTKKEHETRFFLSKSQYQRMQRMKLRDGQAAQEVYIILRVFNLDNDDIDMRIYVDPEGMRAARTLDFTAESWSVVPGRSGE